MQPFKADMTHRQNTDSSLCHLLQVIDSFSLAEADKAKVRVIMKKEQKQTWNRGFMVKLERWSIDYHDLTGKLVARIPS